MGVRISPEALHSSLVQLDRILGYDPGDTGSNPVGATIYLIIPNVILILFININENMLIWHKEKWCFTTQVM